MQQQYSPQHQLKADKKPNAAAEAPKALILLSAACIPTMRKIIPPTNPAHSFRKEKQNKVTFSSSSLLSYIQLQYLASKAKIGIVLMMAPASAVLSSGTVLRLNAHPTPTLHSKIQKKSRRVTKHNSQIPKSPSLLNYWIEGFYCAQNHSHGPSRCYVEFDFLALDWPKYSSTWLWL